VGRELVTVSNPDVVLEIVGRIVKWAYELASSDTLLPEQLDDLDFSEFKKEIQELFAEKRVWPPEGHDGQELI